MNVSTNHQYLGLCSNWMCKISKNEYCYTGWISPKTKNTYLDLNMHVEKLFSILVVVFNDLGL